MTREANFNLSITFVNNIFNTRVSKFEFEFEFEVMQRCIADVSEAAPCLVGGSWLHV